jgi:anaerobic magnesium-protoporphyrin IX monomethyl ester cyclase
MPPWRIILWVKFIEIALQLRPRIWYRMFLQPDRAAQHGMRWFMRMGRRVWPHEWWSFFFRDGRVKDGPPLQEFWGAPQDHQEILLQIVRRTQPTAVPEATINR